MEINTDKAVMWSGLIAAITGLWRNLRASGKDAQDSRDARTLEMFKMHVFPKLDKIQSDVDATRSLCERMVPELASNIVKQSIEASSTTIFTTAKELIKIAKGEG